MTAPLTPWDSEPWRSDFPYNNRIRWWTWREEMKLGINKFIHWMDLFILLNICVHM